MFNKETIIARYDQAVKKTKAAGISYQIVIADLEAEFAEDFEDHSIRGLDVPELIADSVRYHIQSERSYRRQNLKKMFAALGDKMDYPPESREYKAAVKRLSQNFGKAYPLGVEDGKDKTLGQWYIEDVENSKKSRSENLAKQRAAVKQFSYEANRALRAISEGVGWK